MALSPLADKPAPKEMLIDPAQLDGAGRHRLAFNRETAGVQSF
jgi:hypothetical protein